MTRRVRLVGIVLGVLSLTVLLLWPLNGGPFADATTRQVMMMGNAFSATTLTISVGDRVTWVNHDQVPHDATTTNAPVSFRSPMMEQGDTWMYQFTTPGTYEYYCSIHPDMRAKIIVKAAAEPDPEPSSSKPAPKAPEKPKPQPTSKAPAPPGPDPEPNEEDEPEPKAPSSKGKKVTPTKTAAAVAHPSAHPTARAAPVAVPAAAPTATAQPVAAVTTPITTLNPLLLVAGLVTAVLVFALLVLSSRPQ